VKAHTLIALIPLVMLAACSKKEAPPPASPEATPSQAPATPPPTAAAQVILNGPASKSTPPGNSVTGAGGTLQLATAGDGVQINGQVTGLAANTEHGFHIHQTGDCSAADFKSAGEHFNPDGALHGAPDSATHHLGDLAALKSDEQGTANVSATIAGATLKDGGVHDLVGKALIVHAKADDYKTQPSGNSGDRIACGVITALP